MLLVSPEYKEVTESWFFPGFWKGRAKPVTSGGRGGAWFVDSESASLVLRHYRRGGLVAKLAEQTYLFTGFDRARSLAEFRLLEHLKSLGLPVPDPVAAIAWKYRLFWYRAAILVKRIPGAVTFADCERLTDEGLWQQLGRMVRQFHDQGLDHVDLNCDNVLVANETLYLIDFDRCQLRSSFAGSAERWKRANLMRLQRSMRKRLVFSGPELEHYWQTFVTAYYSD